MSNCNSLWLTLHYTVKYHLHRWYVFSESAPLLSSMVFSGLTKCSDLSSKLSTGYFSYLGPPKAQKGQKRAKTGIFTIKETYLME